LVGAWKNSNPAVRDALEQAIRCVDGYCSSANHVFREDFEEWHFFRKLPPASDQK
jgi:hypothetical protein